jgi:hypothetical protein
MSFLDDFVNQKRTFWYSFQEKSLLMKNNINIVYIMTTGRSPFLRLVLAKKVRNYEKIVDKIYKKIKKHS